MWFQLVKSIVWLRLMTLPSCQSDRPSTAVDTVESRVGIASEFLANSGAGQIKLSGDSSLVEAFTPPFFGVEPFFLSQMFSLHATG
ncbi:putative lipoprotein, partial [Candidatus Erwinia dacicola]